MRRYGWMVMLALFALGCRPKPKMEIPPSGTALVGGQITVAGSDDFNGIQLDVVARGDTLFKAVTDLAGTFATTARVPEPAIYALQVSRNGIRLHVSEIVLAPGDSIRITGEIPNLRRTFTIASRENDAWNTYVRVKLQYDRLIRNSLQLDIPTDSILSTAKRWSDLFDSVEDNHPGTYAAREARYLAARMLNGVDDARMIGKLNALGFSRTAFDQRLMYGAEARFRQGGAKAAYGYVDSLKRLTADPILFRMADKRRVEIAIFDADIDRSLAELSRFLSRYSDREHREWALGLRYELENLIPGRILPPFTVPLRGDSLVSANLAGKPYMIEFVAFTDPDYQRAYPRLLDLQTQAARADIAFITVPVDANEAVWNGFFTERPRRWTVAPPGAFQRSGLPEVLRVEQLPTRFLVGADGMVLLRSFDSNLDELQGYIQALTQPPAMP
jgi:hypothetical protein